MIFRRAKLRLAASYAVVQLILFAAFGIGVYLYVTSAFDFDAGDGDRSANTAEAGFAALRTGLITAYLALVVVIPVTSYLLATLAMRPILASFEAQQRFVDDASHEFRTPLSALQAQLELGLSRPRSSTEYRATLGRSLDATSQLDEILNDLLVLSRGAWDANVDMREVEVSEVVDAAVAQLTPADAARVTRAAAPELVIMSSPSMLSRAIVNLLTNSLRYSEPGSVITLSLSKRGGTARIAVEDHGIGMSRLDLQRAFDRFWRADTSRSSRGRGLGLSIVREIVGLHRGRVELSSELGVGTTAVIDIPLSR